MWRRDAVFDQDGRATFVEVDPAKLPFVTIVHQLDWKYLRDQHKLGRRIVAKMPWSEHAAIRRRIDAPWDIVDQIADRLVQWRRRHERRVERRRGNTQP